jgi:hypothetical protein
LRCRALERGDERECGSEEKHWSTHGNTIHEGSPRGAGKTVAAPAHSPCGPAAVGCDRVLGWCPGERASLYLASVTASDWVNSYVPNISVHRIVSTVVAVIDEPDTRPE